MARSAVRSVALDKAYFGRANSFGLLRLLFAFAVLFTHSGVLGYGRPLTTRVDVAGLAVAGFFGVSGFLIMRSAQRTRLPRFLWHRILRIMPALWTCLLVTSLLVAPVLWWLRHGTLDRLWRSNSGALDYLRNNWTAAHQQYGIGDLLVDTPYGQMTGASVMNGSLWTLSYEIACYLIVGLLAATSILKRARWALLGLAAFVFTVMFLNAHAGQQIWQSGVLGPVPLLGGLIKAYFLWFGFMFLLGAVAAVYARHVLISDALGVFALVVAVTMVATGQHFSPVLMVAFEYVILWSAVRLPSSFQRVGQRNDYSYGVYIYAFLIQQVLARFGVHQWGLVPYAAVTVVATMGFAVASWHLVEKRALRLKSWTPRWPRRLPRKVTEAEADTRASVPTASAAESPEPAPA